MLEDTFYHSNVTRAEAMDKHEYMHAHACYKLLFHECNGNVCEFFWMNDWNRNAHDECECHLFSAGIYTQIYACELCSELYTTTGQVLRRPLGCCLPVTMATAPHTMTPLLSIYGYKPNYTTINRSIINESDIRTLRMTTGNGKWCHNCTNWACWTE